MLMIEAPLYLPTLGKSYRILLHYGGYWHGIFWFQVEKDGSIYAGPRFETVDEMKVGSKLITGEDFVRWDEGSQIDPLTQRRVSFHASGVINAGGKRFTGEVLRDLESRKTLCSVLFEHPSAYPVVKAIRSTDVCLNYNVDDSGPFQAFLSVYPSRDVRALHVREVKTQTNLLFRFDEVGFVLEFVLATPYGFQEYPPMTYVVWSQEQS